MNYDRRHDVFLEPGSPVGSQWCEDCALPSAVRVPMVAISPLGAHVRSAIYLCTACDLMLTIRL